MSRHDFLILYMSMLVDGNKYKLVNGRVVYTIANSNVFI